ncbi:GNAT family N-acetyltransferase [Haloarchaeobius sp. HME9146]|uniref:GNAT family N-acetyltransferase n=1 Tax=Haloarchaeobius sp. HME9146 TaxID=2978732 RepID=UPI0021BF44C3|nr:GNAT family protein [Haloarchaeobius sp. HME9146]MCT9097834.1 GNAT family N-acetyltransferase [Haloarchaeobius sp. HME9146]
MGDTTFLRGDRLSLRAVEPTDLDFLRQYQNDPDLRGRLTRAFPQTISDAESFLNSVTVRDNLAFIATEGGDRVGFVALFDVEHVPGRARLGYWVVPEHQGQGYATEMVTLVVDYAFDELRLHKVTADTLASNEASGRVLEKCGFEREGVLREHEYIDGEHVDSHLYAVLRSSR